MTEQTTTETEIEIDETLPEVVKNFLRSGARLEHIVLRAHGEWAHRGQRFDNKKVAALFSRSVDRTPGGTWILVIGRFTYPITVEDTGFFIERMDLTQTPPQLTVSDGTTQALDPATLRYAAGGRLYCAVRDGAFEARFKRDAYHALADHLDAEEDGTIVLVLDDQRIPLAALDDED